MARTWSFLLARSAVVLLALTFLAPITGDVIAQQRPQQPPPSPVPTGNVQDWFTAWPLPRGAEQYADIDGRRMHRDVVAQAEIARRYRDQVHPKFWGRITGAESDTWAAEWLAGRFRAVGVSDVRIQPLDLLPQWFPGQYSVTVSSGDKSVELTSAQPFYRSNGTPAGGLDVEAVYVGLGNAPDFEGKDVRGKAVFTYSMLSMPGSGALRRAGEGGAAVVFDAQMLPGNMRYQAYPAGGVEVPAFVIGGDDSQAVLEMFSSGQPVRVRANLETRLVPNLKSALVWATLPGASDETVYLIAHRDGWFDASGDNASGVATIIGLAEHYAKIPQAQRPRTIVFVGLDGHHNSGEGAGVGRMWMVANAATLFPKTALMINAEHPSTVQTTVRPRYGQGQEIFWTNTYTGQMWYAGGPTRPELERITRAAFREFGVWHYPEPNTSPPAGDLGRFYQIVPGVATSDFHNYFHTDHETPETVPWTGLEASARAYARIIDEVNKLPLSALQRPTTN